MKTARLAFTLLVLVALASPTLATDYPPRTTAELVQDSQLVVVGVAAKEKEKMVIRVSEVLKGEKTKLVSLNSVAVGPYRDVAIRSGDKGEATGPVFEPAAIPIRWRKLPQVDAGMSGKAPSPDANRTTTMSHSGITNMSLLPAPKAA